MLGAFLFTWFYFLVKITFFTHSPYDLDSDLERRLAGVRATTKSSRKIDRSPASFLTLQPLPQQATDAIWPPNLDIPLCKPRIYVYPDPPAIQKVYERVPVMNTPYISERILLEQIRDPTSSAYKNYVTDNPEEADFFYIPFLGARYLNHCWFILGEKGDCDVDEKYVKPWMQFVQDNNPYWNRSNGEDHLIVHPMDRTSLYYHTKETMENATFLTTIGDLRPLSASVVGARRYKNIPIPSATALLNLVKADPSKYLTSDGYPRQKRRDIFLLFGGRYQDVESADVYSAGVRSLLRNGFDKQKDYVIGPGWESEKYMKLLSRSRFGLAPVGHTLDTTRVWEYIAFGVVPVIIADGIIEPFEDDVDWSSFSIRIAREDAHRMDAILRSIPEKEYQRKRERVWNYGRRVLLTNDAWHLIVRDLCRRHRIDGMRTIDRTHHVPLEAPYNTLRVEYLDHVRFLNLASIITTTNTTTATKATTPQEVDDQTTVDLLAHCQSLKRLSCSVTLHLDPILLPLLRQNPQIRQFNLSETQMPHPANPRILETVTQYCAQLTDIRFSYLKLDRPLLTQLKALAPRLKGLRLIFCQPYHSKLEGTQMNSNSDDSSESWTDDKDFATSWPAFPELRDLKVKNSSRYDCEDLLQWFAKSPKLESLNWTILHKIAISSFVHAITNILLQCSRQQERHHPDGAVNNNQHGSRNSSNTSIFFGPRLDSIKIRHTDTDGRTGFVTDTRFAQLFRAWPSLLRRLSIPGCVIGIESWNILRERGYFDTIEVVHLSICRWMVQEILASFPQLREIRVGTLREFEVVSGAIARNLRIEEAWSQLDIIRQNVKSDNNDRNKTDEEIEKEVTSLVGWSPPEKPPKPWVCHRLRVFRMSYHRMSDVRESYGDDDETTKEQKKRDKKGFDVHRQFFDRLAALKELEEINICPGGTTRSYGFNPVKYPGYMGLDLTEMIEEGEQIHWNDEVSGQKNIAKMPVGPGLLRVWPKLTKCRVSR
ncbi:hypothetical protein BGZ83_001042 [Gryganskiella cystojenkinii]|nr:hypothetical protein BGZ83_001042 [Gryganskiella cystojenkinii]